MSPLKLAILLLAAAIVGGCLESGGPTGVALQTSHSPRAPATVAPADAAPANETGSVLATVTDPELRPLEAAHVELLGTGLVAQTDVAGAAKFVGINPGRYTVLAAKPGFAPREDRGKQITVVADETTEVTFVLDPQAVQNAQDAYHTSLPFKAFITCGIEGQPGTSLPSRTPCGQYLAPGGVQLGDPNHKTRFTWMVEKITLQGIVVDAKWAPATGATGQQLRFVVTHLITCSAVACFYANPLLDIGGRSPVQGVALETEPEAFTKRWGKDAAKYPLPGYFETGAYCQTNCTGAQLVFHQSVDQWLTSFYGKDPPAGFSALPS